MLERLADAPVAEVVIVVEGAYPIEARRVELGGVRVVTCPDWALGPGASLRCGLAALGDDVEAALIVLADGPQLDPRAVERLIAHRDRRRLVVASYDGTRDHPAVLVTRRAGRRSPTRARAALEATLVPCDDLEPPGDMDYPHLWQPPEGGYDA